MPRPRAGPSPEWPYPPPNKQQQVAYAIGKLSQGKNQANADIFLAYLASEAAQAIYGKYGFLPAAAEELSLKDIPPP